MDVETLGEHLQKFNTYGYSLVAMVFGHELGLFDKMRNAGMAITSSELADIAGMKERYVREWLGAMVAAEVIQIDTVSSKYFIPQEHYRVIATNAALGKGAMLSFNRFEKIKSFFNTDGNWGSSFDEDFWQFYCGMCDATASKTYTLEIMPYLEQVETLLCKLEQGADVLDVGCGSGTLSIPLAKRFPYTHVTALDLSAGILNTAKQRAIDSCTTNISFVQLNANYLSKAMNNMFDLIMVCDTLHDMPDPKKVLEEIQTVLGPSGILLISDMRIHAEHSQNIGDMVAAMMYTFSMFFCLPNSLSQEPRIGYGRCWGEEEMVKTVSAFNFTLQHKFELPDKQGLYFFSKKT